MIPEILFFKHLQPYNAPAPYKIRGKNNQITDNPGKFADIGQYYLLQTQTCLHKPVQ